MSLGFLRYPGGKSKMLPILSEYIDKILINQNSFCEPFAGSAAATIYVAQKYTNIKLFLNDFDKYIASLWMIVSGQDGSLKLDELLELLRQPATMEQFYKLRDEPAIDNVQRAYRAIFFNRTCFSGIVKRNAAGTVISNPIGGFKQLSKYKIDCRWNTEKLISKIKICNALLQGRTYVSNKDFSEYEILTETDIPVYSDAPYVKNGPQLYSEFMNSEQHKQLSQILLRRKNWVASYDFCPEILEMYKESNLVYIDANYSINGIKKNWSKKQELIILP